VKDEAGSGSGRAGPTLAAEPANAALAAVAAVADLATFREVIAAALAAHQDEPGALLPILHDIVDRLGYLPEETVARVADGLNLSRAEVHGVITFYPDFRTEPPGRHLLKMCRAEACQSMGADALLVHLKQRHHLAPGDTSADGAITIEPVYCLGNCALSPALLLDGVPHGRLTTAKLDRLIGDLIDRARDHVSDDGAQS
jgi:formate dehydrogenase subunit gamma